MTEIERQVHRPRRNGKIHSSVAYYSQISFHLLGDSRPCASETGKLLSRVRKQHKCDFSLDVIISPSVNVTSFTAAAANNERDPRNTLTSLHDSRQRGKYVCKLAAARKKVILDG